MEEQLSGMAALQAKVKRLEQQIEDSHISDYNSLARAYRSLLQHIQALQVEAQIMKKHIDALDVEVMNPDEVSNQLTVAGIVAAVAVAANRVLTGRRLVPLRHMVYVGGTLYLGISLTAATLGRLGSLLVHNRQRKRRLEHDWDALTERIRIMDETSRWKGQSPSLLPPGFSDSPPRSEGAASNTSGWVALSPEEGEGCVTYPSAGSSAHHRSDSGDGVVSYPKVNEATAGNDDVMEGIVSYPSASKGAYSPLQKVRQHGRKGSGNLEMPSAPPMPLDQEETKMADR